MFAFLPHPRMQIQMDLTIMDMQIKMVHTLLQKLYTHLMLKQMESSVFLLMIMLSFASMETLKRHLPISGPEGLHELKKIVERFEEKIYSTATSQILCSRNCLSSSFILASPFALKVYCVKDMLFRYTLHNSLLFSYI
eukprot:XP_019073531.1 PREDICTED: uncharacterized protein LOC104878063 isoform X2 [Vitis vinifera]